MFGAASTGGNKMLICACCCCGLLTVSQTLKLAVLLLPCLLVAGISTILLLAIICGQITSDEAFDLVLPQPQKLRTPHPVLVGLSGEPLLLADGQQLGIMPNPADGGKTLALVSAGRPVRGLNHKALTFNLAGPKGRTLVDDAGATLLGSGGVPLEVGGAERCVGMLAAQLAVTLPLQQQQQMQTHLAMHADAMAGSSKTAA